MDEKGSSPDCLSLYSMSDLKQRLLEKSDFPGRPILSAGGPLGSVPQLSAPSQLGPSFLVGRKMHQQAEEKFGIQKKSQLSFRIRFSGYPKTTTPTPLGTKNSLLSECERSELLRP
jgi:hypothetical protein